MQVTNVRVRLFEKPDNKLKGFATITFDDCFMVHNIRIIDGNNGLFVAMPDRKLKDGEYVNVAHPMNNETRKMITDAILAEYEVVKDTVARGESAPANDFSEPPSDALSMDMPAPGASGDPTPL